MDPVVGWPRVGAVYNAYMFALINESVEVEKS
jgi:hypothetical protein